MLGNYYKIAQNGIVEEIKGVAFSTNNVNVKQGKNVEIEIINVTGEELQFTPTTSNGITIAKGENNKITISASSDAEIGTTVSFTATAGMDNDICNATVIYDKAGDINKKIGNNVNYSVSVTGQTDPIDKWQVFYADDENKEVFIISEDVLEKGVRYDINNQKYSTGSAFVRSTHYGNIYNKIWLKECEGLDENGNSKEVTSIKAKGTAYLCDSSRWSEYSNGTFGSGEKSKLANTMQTYAAGSPTLELIIASVKESYPQNYTGWKITATQDSYNYTSNIIYSGIPYLKKGVAWGLASPKQDSNDLYGINSNGQLAGITFQYSNVRPLISVPLDDFDLDWIITTNN